MATEDGPRGLYPKYLVYKPEKGVQVNEALDDVFVLRPERDHAARAALRAYAEATHNFFLAEDLRGWLEAIRWDENA